MNYKILKPVLLIECGFLHFNLQNLIFSTHYILLGRYKLANYKFYIPSIFVFALTLISLENAALADKKLRITKPIGTHSGSMNADRLINKNTGKSNKMATLKQAYYCLSEEKRIKIKDKKLKTWRQSLVKQEANLNKKKRILKNSPTQKTFNLYSQKNLTTLKTPIDEYYDDKKILLNNVAKFNKFYNTSVSQETKLKSKCGKLKITASVLKKAKAKMAKKSITN